jgi:hypothetical protein
METEQRRGPGRPPKQRPETLETMETVAERDSTERHIPCRVVEYKIFTSQGRFIAGERAHLPEREAREFANKGLVEIL